MATELERDALGLRERKKRQTRQRIAEAARKLFAERGFERVTVADVARAADVSDQTVFNYFPSKEDLVYWRLGAFQDELLAAVRDRAEGEPALEAFGRFVLARRGLLADPDPEMRGRLVGLIRAIANSPALLAREQQIFAGYTDALAAALAEETGAGPGDPEPWIAANAMLGVHRALVTHARRHIVEHGADPALAGELREHAERALALLAHGLGDYAPGGRGAPPSDGRP
jgi:AcrR family transcriptional regulator